MSFDSNIIHSAFQRVCKLEMLYGDAIPWHAIQEGFKYSGEKVLLANQVQGIFKPKVLQRGPISIKTTIPKGNNVNIYNDQLNNAGYYQYSLETGDPYGERNVLLWQAYEDKSPFIYFHAVSPAIYKAIFPCFVRNILPELGYAEISIGNTITESNMVDNEKYAIASEIESRYMVRESKVRLHQASFREAVLMAYSNKCAITGLPVPKLLEAAHIIPDQEMGEMQTVNNGISLSRIHHRAYDANLIGIDPDYKIHISDELYIDDGGSLLEDGILKFNGKRINVPRSLSVRPNKEYLAKRYEEYKDNN